MRLRQSPYMHWAKTASRARFNLATSGVGSFPLADLPPTALEINGDNSYGYRPLIHAIARKHGVDPDCVVTSAGTSMANHLALAALIEPGDEVLVETPTYELIVSSALYLGADVRRFERHSLRQAISSRTRLVVITNLHNPTSEQMPESALREIGDLARSVHARVLVDEVYLDTVFDNTPPTSFLLGPEFVVTSSLTKVYGVSGLRCGWILGEPDLARSLWRLNDLFSATPAHPAELLSVTVFENLPLLRDRARRLIDADRQLLAAFLAAQNKVSAARTEWGTTAFLKLHSGDVEAFLARLRDEFETSAVPGRFFDAPDHFRIGMGVDHEMFAEGLRRLEIALDT